ncbi:MAG: alpha/beta fold hydrolase [Alphaproteobacteria bacterium]
MIHFVDKAGDVTHRIKAVIRARPDRLAVTAGEARLTYGELGARAGAVAESVDRALAGGQARVPDASPLVCLLLPHDESMVTAIVGVLFAGQGYVPLDTRSPAARLRRMVALSGARVLITTRALADLAATIATRLTVLCLEDIPDGSATGAPSPRAAPVPARAPRNDEPAYLLFTSGTTGEPKGVAHSRASLARSTDCFIDDCDLGEDDRVALIISCSFTPSVFCIFGALTTGARLCLYDLHTAPIEGVAPWIARERVTSLYAVPTLFRRIAESSRDCDGVQGHDLTCLRWIQLAGEPVLAHDVALHMRHFASHAKLYNGMGTTETSCVTRHVVGVDDAAGPAHGPVPIGQPYDDVTVRLESPSGTPVPNGTPGEIVIKGRHVAAGYWRDPRRTEGRFSRGADGLWTFRTGDLGIRQPDGTISHLGRMDAQVKINGQRVEPGETETALLALSEIRDAVVMVRQDGEGPLSLIAYVTPSGAAPLDTACLRSTLAQSLPPHQIPARFVRLTEMPLTVSGKINRSALPMSLAATPALPHRTAAAGDMIAEVIGRFFGKVLRTEPAGPDDDFFALGGDSLQAVELCLMIEQHCGSVLSASTLAQFATPRALAAFVRRTASAHDCPGVVVLHQTDLGDPDPAAVPLFCISGMGGHVLCWRELSVLLGPGHPCYGLEMPGLDGRSAPLETVDEIVTAYHERITCVAPTGPVAVAGYSAGGVFALELARRLEAHGRSVSVVAMLDTYAPERMRPLRKAEVVKGWVRFAGTRPAGTVARTVTRRIGVKLGMVEPEPATFSRPEDIEDILLTMPFDREHTAVQACERALQAYVARPLDRDILFFRAQTPPPPAFGTLDLYGAWNRLCRGRMQIVSVPGSHPELLNGPSIAAIAEHLGRALRPGENADRAASGVLKDLSAGGGALGPLGAYWTLDGGEPIRGTALKAGAVPAPYRGLLDHDKPLTPTLARFHGQPMAIRILAQRRVGRHYVRKIIMEGEETGTPVQIAVIRIALGGFDLQTQELICNSDRPFGQILRQCGIPFTCRPDGFFSVVPDRAMAAALHLDPETAPVLFGRRNQLTGADGSILADVIEILAPSDAASD